MNEVRALCVGGPRHGDFVPVRPLHARNHRIKVCVPSTEFAWRSDAANLPIRCGVAVYRLREFKEPQKDGHRVRYVLEFERELS